MLSEAIDRILKEQADDRARQERREAHRQQVRALDRWLHAVEELIAEGRRTIPEPLFREIGAFLRQHTPALDRQLQSNRRRDAARVLDVLFDAQGALQGRSGTAVSGAQARSARLRASGVQPPAPNTPSLFSSNEKDPPGKGG